MRDSFSVVGNVAVQSEQKTPRRHCMVRDCAIIIKERGWEMSFKGEIIM